MIEDEHAHRVPLRLTLLSIAALWGCYFIVASLRSWAMGFELSWTILAYRLAITLISMAVFVALVPLVRLLDKSTVPIRIAAVVVAALPVSLLLAGVNNTIFAEADESMFKPAQDGNVRIRRDEAGNVLIDMPDRVVIDEGGDGEDGADSLPTVRVDDAARAIRIAAPEKQDTTWKVLADVAFGRYFLVLAWAALYFALVKAEEARIAERREGEFRRAAAASELRSLRYQVNPHFLFNTLNSLSALVMTDRGEKAEEMIQTLSTFYRRTLSSEPTSDVTLADEIELQKLYLAIEAVRFPERLKTRIDLPEALSGALVPGMILQPLIENSVKYAVAACREPVTVTISAERREDRLVLTVCDDGPMTETGDPHGCGIGLGNVRDRLRTRFGEEAALRFGPQEQGGFCTTIEMPLELGRV